MCISITEVTSLGKFLQQVRCKWGGDSNFVLGVEEEWVQLLEQE